MAGDNYKDAIELHVLKVYCKRS